jgi:hypothetical protein
LQGLKGERNIQQTIKKEAKWIEGNIEGGI